MKHIEVVDLKKHKGTAHKMQGWEIKKVNKESRIYQSCYVKLLVNPVKLPSKDNLQKPKQKMW